MFFFAFRKKVVTLWLPVQKYLRRQWRCSCVRCNLWTMRTIKPQEIKHKHWEALVGRPQQVERVKKRRTHVTARIQQRIGLDRKRVFTANSPQLEETGGPSSSVTGHVVCHPVHCYHQFTSEVWAPCSRTARVRPRTTYTTTGGERTRALSQHRRSAPWATCCFRGGGAHRGARAGTHSGGFSGHSPHRLEPYRPHSFLYSLLATAPRQNNLSTDFIHSTDYLLQENNRVTRIDYLCFVLEKPSWQEISRALI